jgi:V/A-type H+-transporting ATPase subunit I
MVGIIVEVYETIEMLSNTILFQASIMLLVHSALLVTVNGAFKGWWICRIDCCNIGIMMIEGLIVYIQTIRLHL